MHTLGTLVRCLMIWCRRRGQSSTLIFFRLWLLSTTTDRILVRGDDDDDEEEEDIWTVDIVYTKTGQVRVSCGPDSSQVTRYGSGGIVKTKLLVFAKPMHHAWKQGGG
jgi:hypothetical protein